MSFFSNLVSLRPRDEGDGNDEQGQDNNAQAPPPDQPPQPQETPDEIRAKRLARLEAAQKAAQAQAPASSAPGPSAPAVVPPPAVAPMRPKTAPAQRAAPTPMDITPTSNDAESAKVTKPSPKKQQTYEEWADVAISRIFSISLQPTHNPDVLHLASLGEELAEEAGNPEGFVPRLNKDNVDRVIVERLSMQRPGVDAPIADYLFKCFERTIDERLRIVGNAPEKQETIKAAVDLIVSYTGIVLQNSDMFQDTPQAQAAGPLQLLSTIERMDSAAKQYITLIVERFKDEGLDTIFQPILTKVFQNMQQVVKPTAFPDLKYPHMLTFLFQHKLITALATQLQYFTLTPQNARQLEGVTFLGPFYRVSPFPFDIRAMPEDLFPEVTRITQQELDAQMISHRGWTRLATETLKNLSMCLLKAGPDAKEKFLQWIATVLNMNAKRTKMHFEPGLHSSEGFMMNMTCVMMQLCMPFIDPDSDKAKLIDSAYMSSTRINLENETRLFADNDEVKAWEEKQEKKNWNFISECFFLAARSFSVGISSSINTYMKVLKQMSHEHSARRELEASRNSWGATPLAAQNERVLEQMEKNLKIMTRYRFCFEIILLDPEVLSTAIRFQCLVAGWIMRLADAPETGLPLPAEPSDTFRVVPEYILENLGDFFVFVARYQPDQLLAVPLEPIFKMFVTFLNSPKYMKNPYIRGKFMEVLCQLAPIEQGNTSLLTPLYENMPIIQQHLCKGLLNYYIEIEHTGDSNQFYIKFNQRYRICLLMKYLWTMPVHQKAVIEYGKDTSTFLQLVNMILNDSIYLLDEALEKLIEIRTDQVTMESAEWDRMNPQQRREVEGRMRANERDAISDNTLAMETLDMMFYLSDKILTPFLLPEMVDRVAAMLDINLAALVGPKCTDLKVKNPEKYHFDPRKLLQKIVGITLHFAHSEEFQQAVARDGRSYSKQVYDKAGRILQREQLVSSTDLNRFAKLCQDVEAQVAQAELDEEALGDIPDEFLDPLLQTLMKDPVTLPTSGTVMDRSTIARHLLSDPMDPFNRAPLKIEDVIPNPEIKAKIDAFIKEAKENKMEE
eukprot:GFYU01001669.1.p1 GENE.GFYU01001669.1~~GFYU01001669.1.p1  ORF type:complete len:1071 (-),score=326.59 GFYU01001669.1:216-3428(-)